MSSVFFFLAVLQQSCHKKSSPCVHANVILIVRWRDPLSRGKGALKIGRETFVFREEALGFLLPRPDLHFVKSGMSHARDF